MHECMRRAVYDAALINLAAQSLCIHCAHLEGEHFVAQNNPLYTVMGVLTPPPLGAWCPNGAGGWADTVYEAEARESVE